MSNQSRKPLSKTRLMDGFQCERRLWLKLHKPELEAEIDTATQMKFDEGNEVGEIARKHFGEGTLITNDYWDYKGSVQKTSELIHVSTKTIFEASFQHEEFFSRADIFTKIDDGWHVIEVKKSTSVKDYQILDSAIQTWIIRNCGHTVSKISLMHINNKCIYPNLDNLFTTVDITSEVENIMPLIEQNAHKLLEVSKGSSDPLKKIGPHCDDPFECSFKEHCWANVPKKSVFDLPGIKADTKWKLYNKGKVKIIDLNAIEFKNKTKRAIEVTKSGEPWFEWDGIKASLDNWSWPLYFFDFETINPAIPRYPNTKPYKQIPFQFSCHVWTSPDSELQHFEYLHTETSDPRPPLIEAMLKGFGNTGSIVAYNMKFEIGVIKALAEFDQAKSAKLNSLLERFVDPLTIFQNYSYHPEFLGSFSIKDVAPALLGSTINYDDLDVGDGSEAQAAINLLLTGSVTAEEKEKIINDLLKYCRQDTLAMVELVKWLLNRGIAA